MGRRSSAMPDASAPQSPPVPATPVRKPRRTKAAKPRRSPDGLDQLARRLEADWQATLRKHEQSVHRQFQDLRSALHGRKGAKLKGKAVAELRDALAPKLKPGKGRAKDLRRVESALDEALARIP